VASSSSRGPLACATQSGWRGRSAESPNAVLLGLHPPEPSAQRPPHRAVDWAVSRSGSSADKGPEFVHPDGGQLQVTHHDLREDPAWRAARRSQILIVSYSCPVTSPDTRRPPRRMTISSVWAISSTGVRRRLSEVPWVSPNQARSPGSGGGVDATQLAIAHDIRLVTWRLGAVTRNPLTRTDRFLSCHMPAESPPITWFPLFSPLPLDNV
jgi:hypothetical protein